MAKSNAARHPVAAGETPRSARGAARAAAELDRLIHERVRLGIVSALAGVDALSFSDTKIRSSVYTPLWGLCEQSFDGDILYIGNHDNRGEVGPVNAQPTLSKNRIEDFADELNRNYHRVNGYSLKEKLKEARERAGRALVARNR